MLVFRGGIYLCVMIYAIGGIPFPIPIRRGLVVWEVDGKLLRMWVKRHQKTIGVVETTITTATTCASWVSMPKHPPTTGLLPSQGFIERLQRCEKKQHPQCDLQGRKGQGRLGIIRKFAQMYARWWFQIFFMFTPIWGRFPF